MSPCTAAQGHRPQILDAKIFRRKVEKREEERESEVKEGRKEWVLVCRYRYLSLTFRGNTFVLVPVVTKEVKSAKLVYKLLLLLLEILGSGHTNCTVL
jgi:hypothetical protein